MLGQLSANVVFPRDVADSCPWVSVVIRWVRLASSDAIAEAQSLVVVEGLGERVDDEAEDGLHCLSNISIWLGNRAVDV